MYQNKRRKLNDVDNNNAFGSLNEFSDNEFNGSDNDNVKDNVKKCYQPPINVKTIKDLNFINILKNDQIRLEVCKSPLIQLEFKRNADYDDISNDQYWDELSNEIEHVNDNDTKSLRLTTYIKNVKLILLSVIPKFNKSDYVTLNETLNENFIVFRLKNQNINLMTLFNYLNNLLKTHCAPIRDKLIDEMVSHSTDNVITSLKILLNLLELMKLDIINHQLLTQRSKVLNLCYDLELKKVNQFTMTKFDKTKLWLCESKRRLGVKNYEIGKIYNFGLYLLMLDENFHHTLPESLVNYRYFIKKLRSYFNDIVILQQLTNVYAKFVTISNNDVKFDLFSIFNNLNNLKPKVNLMEVFNKQENLIDLNEVTVDQFVNYVIINIFKSRNIKFNQNLYNTLYSIIRLNVNKQLKKTKEMKIELLITFTKSDNVIKNNYNNLKPELKEILNIINCSFKFNFETHKNFYSKLLI